MNIEIVDFKTSTPAVNNASVETSEATTNFSDGETAIIERLGVLEDLLAELIEKVNDISLTTNDGLSIERY